MRVFSTLMSWSESEQELHSSLSDLIREMGVSYESFLNSYVLVKQEHELHNILTSEVCTKVFSTLVSWSSKNKSCMRAIIRIDMKPEFVTELSQQEGNQESEIFGGEIRFTTMVN